MRTDGESWIWNGWSAADRPSGSRIAQALDRPCFNGCCRSQCNAEVEFDLDKAGLRFRMKAPLVEHRLVPEY